LDSEGWMIPFSVMIPEIYLTGVTSKAGFSAGEPGEAMRIFCHLPVWSGPSWKSTSSWLRSSMGICLPDTQVASMVDVGAAI